jgi:hypothetical protein
MASTYLSKAEVDPAGNRKTFTLSVWVKRSKLGTEQAIYSHYLNTNYYNHLRFGTGDQIEYYDIVNGTYNISLDTNRKFRDVNAWYHIVVRIDTTQATEADRVRLYINGEQETSFATMNYPSQDATLMVDGGAGYTNYIGQRGGNVMYFDGLMAHFHKMQGTSYGPSTFGETDSTSGIWKPKTGPSVTYGTKGVFLKFQDSSSLGDDSSGNTNDFTLSGSGKQILDTPSNVFTTGNSLIKGTNGNSNGNNTTTSGQNSWESMWSTLGASSGKWYAEFKPTNLGTNVGMAAGATQTEEIKTFDEIVGKVGGVHYQSHGSIYNNNVETESGGSPYSTYTTNDIIGVAIDLDNNYIYFAKNGTWQNSGDPTSGASGTGGISLTANKVYHFGFGAYNSTVTANFGNGYFATTAVSSAENDDAGYGKFEYDVPAGYYALCTKNINTYG